MDLYTIAYNNIRRRLGKTLLVTLGLVVGVATVVALFGIVEAMRLELGDRMDEFGANIIILPRADGTELAYGGVHSVEVTFGSNKLTEEDLPKIDEIPERKSINIIQPKLVGAVDVEGKKALLVGADTRSESSLKPWFSLQDHTGLPQGAAADLALFELPPDGVLLGAGAAQSLQKGAGGEIRINGKRFVVYGVLNRTGAQEDGLIFAALPAVQQLLGRPGELSMIEISAYCNFCPIEEAVAQLSNALPNARVAALRQAALIREETISRFYSFGLVLCVLVLIVTALTVMVATLTSVNERTREIGIFRSIGFRSSHIAQIIVLETVMVSFTAGVLGYLAGFAAANLFGPYLARIQAAAPWRTDMLALSILLAVALAAVSSLYPALKAARLDPAEALRFF